MCGARPTLQGFRRTRSMKRPDFRAKWDAVLESGRAAIEMHLVEAARKSFDPDDLDTGEVEPRVSVAEAIRIVRLHGTSTQVQSIAQIEPPEQEVAAIRQRLVDKLEKLRERDMPLKLAQGWSFDDSYDQMVPPGWVKSAEYRPREPEPGTPDFWEQIAAGD